MADAGVDLPQERCDIAGCFASNVAGIGRNLFAYAKNANTNRRDFTYAGGNRPGTDRLSAEQPLVKEIAAK